MISKATYWQGERLSGEECMHLEVGIKNEWISCILWHNISVLFWNDRILFSSCYGCPVKVCQLCTGKWKKLKRGLGSNKVSKIIKTKYFFVKKKYLGNLWQKVRKSQERLAACHLGINSWQQTGKVSRFSDFGWWPESYAQPAC